MEEIARDFIRHLLKQQRETFTENWILRHLLKKAHPSVPFEHLETVIKHMMEHPETTRKVRDPFDVEAEKVIKAFDDQVAVAKTKGQIAAIEKKSEELINQLVALKSKLPDDLPN